MRRSPQAFSPSSKGRPKHEQKAELVYRAVCPGGQRLSALLRQSEKAASGRAACQAEEYIEGGGDAAALEQRFGTPQQVAAAWVDEMEMPELLKALRSRRRVVLTVLAGVIAALAVWLAVCMVSLRDYHQAVDGHVETIVTEVDN